MKVIIFLIVVVLITSTKQKQDCRPYLNVTFYKEGKRVYYEEGADNYHSKLPIKTEGGFKIYSDSVSVKILNQ